jgi:iron complex transport system substrate-binding protein
MNRRRFTIATLAVAASAPIAPKLALAQEASPAAQGPQADGSWVFTDDRGVTVELPETPTRIFADLGAGLALWEFGIKPVGLVGYSGVFEIPEELADVPFLDLDAGELDLEQVIAIAPDLSVGQAWSTNNPTDFAGFDEATWPGFSDLAPTLCILAVVEPVDSGVARFGELAVALGADPNDQAAMEERAAFVAASEEVRAAAGEKPDLKVMAISATSELIYVGNPNTASDLVYFASLGVNLVVPESPMAVMDGLWEELSWEEIGQYPVDLYLNDDRPYSLTDEQLLEQEVFVAMPGSNQIAPWTIEYIPSYRALSPILTSLAEAIRNAEVVIE